MNEISGRTEDRISRVEAMLEGLLREVRAIWEEDASKRTVQSLIQNAKDGAKVEAALEADGVATPSEGGGSGRSRGELLPTRSMIDVLLRFQKVRTTLFGSDLMEDPAWTILLDLFSASLADRRISVTSACLASGAPQSTALRYLNEMEELGWIGRCPDPEDGRRTYVMLLPEAERKMREFLGRFNRALSVAA